MALDERNCLTGDQALDKRRTLLEEFRVHSVTVANDEVTDRPIGVGRR